MRLIDADKLNRKNVNYANVPMNFIDIAPTVEAIPKDQYEIRLKADMVAMLTDIQLEIEESPCKHFDKLGDYSDGVQKGIDIIQKKIDALKEQEDGNER